MSPRQIVVDNKKICTKCKEWKNLEDFSNDRRCSSGKVSRCKICLYSGNLGRYHNKPGFKENAKILRDKNTLKNRYGLDKQQVISMLIEQNYSCKICNSKFDMNNKRPFNIDHCHSSQKVRGLLCKLCNLALGGFRDNINYLSSAINYLKRFD